MNNTLAMTLVIAQKKIKETLISPAFYILLTAGLLLVYFITSGFTDIIQSNGLHPEGNAFFEILFSVLSGTLGDSFLERLFAEGPFVLILYLSAVPFLIYLTFSSLFKLGYEKTTGALELVVYGPVGVHSYILGSMVRNIFFMTGYLILITLLSGISALFTNLVLGPVFFTSMILLFFLSFTLCSLCIFCSVIPRYSFASLALFILVTAFFAIIQMGTLASVRGNASSIWSFFAGIIQFISPLFYFMNGLSAINYRNVFSYLLSICILLVMSGVFIWISYFIARKKGVTI
jgi:hypothetical protein